MFVIVKRIMSELRFTREHEWVMREKEIAIIGISEFAQDSNSMT